ncbi:MAG: NADH-dependent [FeFe] hydrogenase, group A6 [Planctomycetia bacterium]|nr:NADH-dependent [FeFe] hydrogenase, group A6 [Planctomycetia bacterium]
MSSVFIEVNGTKVEAVKGETLLTVLRRAGYDVPTLCYHEGLPPTGACRICVVELEGARSLVPSCAYPVAEGLKVKTNSPRVLRARRTIVELLLANHPDDCLYCLRNGNCQLQHLAEMYGIRTRRFAGERSHHPMDLSSPSIVRDPDKCILCGKCVRVCEETQGVACIDFVGRGSSTVIAPAFNCGLNLSSCVNCGQCVVVCPTGALSEKSDVPEVMDALLDPKKYCVVQHAPAVSVALGEEFGLPPGTDVDGKMVTALRRLGFKKVFDTSFSADLTIMEEGSELVDRIKNGGQLPMITSCSPGWIKFIETFYPSLLPHVSSCKSPQQMLGAVIKTYFAQKQELKPQDIFSVSVMPCTAKKFECGRPEMGRDGVQDVDVVLTTRELGRMLRSAGINLAELDPSQADSPLGERTSAGKIFGVTGGVMEAALRSAYFLLTGEEMQELTIEAVRGMDGIKEAHVNINGLEVGVAVCSGLKNARVLLDQIVAGRKDIHFIEVMTCPGGCVNGGGQPIRDRANVLKRADGLYEIDATCRVRVSHRNTEINQLYAEFLEHPLSHKSHELLHTHYHTRENEVMK